MGSESEGDRKLVIGAAGCAELLKGSGFHHGQVIDTDLDGALHVVRKLHEHGLDVTLGRMKVPLLMLGNKGLEDATELRGVRCIHVMPLKWFELAGVPMSRMFMDEDTHEAYRARLKREMLASLNPDKCAQRPCESREQVLGLIKSGEADLLLSVGKGGEGFQHYAVRFNDRGLGEAAREDCLDLYGLR